MLLLLPLLVLPLLLSPLLLLPSLMLLKALSVDAAVDNGDCCGCCFCCAAVLLRLCEKRGESVALSGLRLPSDMIDERLWLRRRCFIGLLLLLLWLRLLSLLLPLELLSSPLSLLRTSGSDCGDSLPSLSPFTQRVLTATATVAAAAAVEAAIVVACIIAFDELQQQRWRLSYGAAVCRGCAYRCVVTPNSDLTQL